MKVTSMVEVTGEVLEFPASSPQEIIDSLSLVKAYQEAYELVEKKLKKMIQSQDLGGYEYNGYKVKDVYVQPKLYDDFVLREEIKDEDTLASFYKQSKTAIDKYLAEHITEVDSHRLRTTMIETGKSYRRTFLEKLS